MAFNFPNSPTLNQVFPAPGGPVYTWNGTAWTTVATGVTATAETRNRLVNPSGSISQEIARGTGAATGAFFADQWSMHAVTTGAPIASTNDTSITDDPDVTCVLRLNGGGTVDAAVAASDYVMIRQWVEGNRIADFKWGTALAKPAVLVFTARSQVAGTFGVSISNAAGTAGYVKNCVIAANVTTKYVIPIPACSTGVWPVDNTASLAVSFAVMAGTTYQVAEGVWGATGLGGAGISNWLATASQSLYIANVGLYRDPQATGTPPRWQAQDEAQELAACMRYWQLVYQDQTAFSTTPSTVYAYTFPLTVVMRTTPTWAVVAAGTPSNGGTGSGSATASRGYFTLTTALSGVTFSLGSRSYSLNARM